MQTIKAIRITSPTPFVVDQYTTINELVDIYIHNINTNRIKNSNDDKWIVNLMLSFYTATSDKDISRHISSKIKMFYSIEIPTQDLISVNQHIMDYFYQQLLSKLQADYTKYTFEVVNF